jgi:hypothetical protein
MRRLSHVRVSLVSLLSMAGIVLTLAHGSGDSQVRLLNASPGESAHTVSAGSTLGSTVHCGTASSYISVTSRSATLGVSPLARQACLSTEGITLSSSTDLRGDFEEIRSTLGTAFVEHAYAIFTNLYRSIRVAGNQTF